MLELSRTPHQSVVVGGADYVERNFKVTVLAISDGCVKLGFEADRELAIHPEEVWVHVLRSRPNGQSLEEPGWKGTNGHR